MDGFGIFWHERVMKMNDWVFYSPENTPALHFALRELELRGIQTSPSPTDDVTHLLLSAPCRWSNASLQDIVKGLPESIHVLGGRLDSPVLAAYRRTDLLEDPIYLARNAMITAHCAVKLASQALPVIWEDCPVLVLGWGRIGKCLCRQLANCGADISVAARKASDRAMAEALGYQTFDIQNLSYPLCRYRVIFNTIPHPVLSQEQLSHCRPGCLKYELASQPGMAGDDIIDARGLPGKYAPESSGRLIARSVLRLCGEKEAKG